MVSSFLSKHDIKSILNYKIKIKIGFHKILIAKRLVISIVEVQFNKL